MAWAKKEKDGDLEPCRIRANTEAIAVVRCPTHVGGLESPSWTRECRVQTELF